MAKKRRKSGKGSYKMTPRRRAALAKARKASARKRRRAAFSSGAKTVGTVAGGLVASAAVYHTNRYLQHPDLAIKHGKAAHGYLKRTNAPKVDPNTVRNRRSVNYDTIGYL